MSFKRIKIGIAVFVVLILFSSMAFAAKTNKTKGFGFENPGEKVGHEKNKSQQDKPGPDLPVIQPIVEPAEDDPIIPDSEDDSSDTTNTENNDTIGQSANATDEEIATNHEGNNTTYAITPVVPKNIKPQKGKPNTPRVVNALYMQEALQTTTPINEKMLHKLIARMDENKKSFDSIANATSSLVEESDKPIFVNETLGMNEAFVEKFSSYSKRLSEGKKQSIKTQVKDYIAQVKSKERVIAQIQPKHIQSLFNKAANIDLLMEQVWNSTI